MAKRDEREDEEFDETEESEARRLSSDEEVEDREEDESDEDEDESDEDEDESDEDEDAVDEDPPEQGHKRAASDREIVEAEPDREAAVLGATRYVHAAFFGAGILAAYVAGKVLQSVWNFLADWPDAVRQVPQLIQYGEDERGTITLAVGAVLGIGLVAYYYKKETVRVWASDVASELSRVTWPNKETVTNGTMVVLVASLVATVYVALLDRFWDYLTNLVYGA